MFRSSEVSNKPRRRARVVAATVVLSWSITTAGVMAIANTDGFKGRADQAQTLAEQSAPSSSTTTSTSTPASTSTSTPSTTSTTVAPTTVAPTTTTTAAPVAPADTESQGPQAGNQPQETDSGRAGLGAQANAPAQPDNAQSEASAEARNAPALAAARPVAAPPTTRPEATTSDEAVSPTPIAAAPVAPVAASATPAAPGSHSATQTPRDNRAPANLALAEPTSSIGNTSPALMWFVVISISLILGLALAAMLLFLRSGVVGAAIGPEMSMAGLRNVADDARLAELQFRRYVSRRVRRTFQRIDDRLRP